METRIVTRHPDPGKEGANISKAIYDQLKESILAVLQNVESLPEQELPQKVAEYLEEKISGDLNWYTETVKLDLLARELIEYEPGKPTHLREKTFF